MLTMTYLTSRSSFLPNAFEWQFLLKVDLLNTVEANSLFSLDMFNLVSINKFQRSMLTFDISAKVAHIGVLSTY